MWRAGGNRLCKVSDEFDRVLHEYDEFNRLVMHVSIDSRKNYEYVPVQAETKVKPVVIPKKGRQCSNTGVNSSIQAKTEGVHVGRF